ncbi:unnamed protein product, partial [Candidula unifasciata]
MATSSKKWKASYDSNRKYNSNWKKTYPWLKRSSDGSEAAYYKLCQCTVAPRITSISNHEKSEKHRMKTPSKSQSQPITTITPRQSNDKVKAAKLQLT